MNPLKALLSIFGLAAFASFLLAAMPASQSGPQPATATSNQGMLQLPASGPGDFSSRLSQCLAGLPATGGFCDARSLSGLHTMSADIVLNKPFTTVLFGPLTLQMAKHRIIVPAGTAGISLIGSSVYGSTFGAWPSDGGTVLKYEGEGSAVVVGDSSTNTLLFLMQDVAVNLLAAGDNATGVTLNRVIQMQLIRSRIFGLDTPSHQTLLKLDGAGNYTGGLIESPYFSNGHTQMLFTGPASTSEAANAVTVLHPHCAGTRDGVAVDLQNGDGNTFLGGDYENFGVAFHVAKQRTSTFVGIRTENNGLDFLLEPAAMGNVVITASKLRYEDHGSRNTFYLGQYSASAPLRFSGGGSPGCADNVIPVPGAAPGDTVSLGTPAPAQNAMFSGFVSSPNQVTVRYCWFQQSPPVEGSFRADAFKH